MQDYKSLHIAVMICDILVNTQTHRQTGFNHRHSQGVQVHPQGDEKKFSREFLLK